MYACSEILSRRRYLCDASVDVHRRYGKLASPRQLMETVNSHDALLHDAPERGERRRALLPHAVRRVAAVVKYLRSGTYSEIMRYSTTVSGIEQKLTAADGRSWLSSKSAKPEFTVR